MPQQNYQRFAISIPAAMAAQIERVCSLEGRNRSEFFREAVRHYMGTARGGSGWAAAAVTAVDTVAAEADKDRLLAQWAQLIETAPGFEDVRSVSQAVDAVAGEAI